MTTVVIGIRDVQLSEYLQLEPNLMLTKAEKLIRQQYAVAEQQWDTKGQLDVLSSHAPIKQRHLLSKKFTKKQDPPATGPRPALPKCRRCGKGCNNVPPGMLHVIDVNMLDITSLNASPKQWQKSQLQYNHLRLQITRTMMMKFIPILFT